MAASGAQQAASSGAKSEETLAYASIEGEGHTSAIVASASMPSDEPSLQAERYDTGVLLGRGGMDEVVLRRDTRIGRQVAQKKLRGELRGAAARARFLREARVQGQLEHPSIVPVYDLGVDERGSTFFTMKCIRGQPLSLILERLAARDPAFLARFPRRRPRSMSGRAFRRRSRGCGTGLRACFCG